METSTRGYALAALGGALFISASATFVRLSEASATASALLRVAIALPVLALLVWIERRRGPRVRLSGAQTWAMRIGGGFLAADLVAWGHTIDAVGAGLATVLGNLQVVFVGVLAWWLMGERISRTVLLALPVMLTGIVLVSGVVGSGAYGDDPVAGVVFGVITSLLYSGYILALRWAATRAAPPPPVEDPPVARRPSLVRPMYEATLGATVTAAVCALVLPDFDVGGTTGLGWLVVLALSSQVVGWLLISAGMPHLPAAVTSVILLVQPVVATGLGALVFGEDPSPAQLAGVALILAGVLLTALRPSSPATPPGRADRSHDPADAGVVR